MESDAYAYCATLTRDQWAWEFLRRHPGYRRDYQTFIAIWRTLEADYGAPPHRDFSGDADLAAPTGELCVVEDERVLLECWMGAKWGFYKFPPDPGCIAPGPDELSWRPPPQPAPQVDDACRLDVSFDLALPLPPQLEAAKFRLVSRAAELRRQGVAAPRTVANQRAGWVRMLQMLDGNVPPQAGHDSLRREAQAMMQGGYLDILRLAPASTDTK
ncbi:MAG: hypothetical protein J0J02_01450 [Thiobacillus sp.]|nr:hypothetical protein [Thiobacillus sp.]